MNLIYGIKDKPSFGKTVLFAIQQLLAIMAATIAVPAIVGNGLSASAALFGAGVGTFIYLLFTKSASPVFLGSSFAFIGSMFSAFGGAASLAIGYWGLIIGAVMAGLVYVIIAVIVKACGTAWIDKLMPPVIIGPTVSIIGLSLSGNAVGDLMKSSVEGGSVYVALICGLVTLAVTMLCSTYSKKIGRLIPFIIGILAGYALASVFAIIGYATKNPSLIVINYSALTSLNWKSVSAYISLPKFTFILGGTAGLKGITGSYLLTLFAAYVPVAFVVFAEHLADHKNLSSIIGTDLLKEPGLTRTLLGDGVGTMVSTLFGGCPNTTYGESIGCIAITGNASVSTIFLASIGCIVLSFFTPFVTIINSIPKCVMGGACIALYGFIAVSGLQMLKKVDLGDNRNLFTVSAILVCGIGGLTLTFGKVSITSLAVAMIVGIITNIIAHNGKMATGEEEPAKDGLSAATESAVDIVVDANTTIEDKTVETSEVAEENK